MKKKYWKCLQRCYLHIFLDDSINECTLDVSLYHIPVYLDSQDIVVCLLSIKNKCDHINSTEHVLAVYSSHFFQKFHISYSRRKIFCWKPLFHHLKYFQIFAAKYWRVSSYFMIFYNFFWRVNISANSWKSISLVIIQGDKVIIIYWNLAVNVTVLSFQIQCYNKPAETSTVKVEDNFNCWDNMVSRSEQLSTFK